MAELRKRGLATAVICSTPFENLGRAQARVLGVPELPLIVIQHPLGGLAMDDVQARAQEASRGVLAVLQEGVK